MGDMKTVGAREANQNFSKLLREAEAGEEIVITRNGKRIARLCPDTSSDARDAKREAALKRLMKLLDKGLDFGGRAFTRDEMHER